MLFQNNAPSPIMNPNLHVQMPDMGQKWTLAKLHIEYFVDLYI